MNDLPILGGSKGKGTTWQPMTLTLELDPTTAEWLRSMSEAMTQEAGEPVTPEIVAQGVLLGAAMMEE